GAEHPEAKAGLVLDAEIVARRAALLAPPGAFDPLRTVGGDDLVKRTPPAKAHRRAVRDRRDRFDRLGVGQEARRPRAQRGSTAEAREGRPAVRERPARLRRHRPGGYLGDVAVVGGEPRDATRAEPRAQAVDQTIEIGVVGRLAQPDLLGWGR